MSEVAPSTLSSVVSALTRRDRVGTTIRLLCLSVLCAIGYAVASVLGADSLVAAMVLRSGYAPHDRRAIELANVGHIYVYLRLLGTALVLLSFSRLVHTIIRRPKAAYRLLCIYPAACLAVYGYVVLTPYPLWARCFQVAQMVLAATLLAVAFHSRTRDDFAAEEARARPPT